MDDSLDRGNFLKILDWYSLRNLEVGKVLNENAPEITNLLGMWFETTKVIISDIGDKFFSLLVDETHNCSVKEQMAIVVRYVNNHELVIECFIGGCSCCLHHITSFEKGD
ncbi:hypothetical protein V2J09_013024 [Rumex salicifolius]